LMNSDEKEGQNRLLNHRPDISSMNQVPQALLVLLPEQAHSDDQAVDLMKLDRRRVLKLLSQASVSSNELQNFLLLFPLCSHLLLVP
jgi:hypothetical protein